MTRKSLLTSLLCALAFGILRVDAPAQTTDADAAAAEKSRGERKVRTGVVVSEKMDTTVLVHESYLRFHQNIRSSPVRFG